MATFSLLHLFKANGRIHRCFTHGGIWTTDIWCRRPQFCQLHQSGHTTCTLTTCGIMTTGMRKKMSVWCSKKIFFFQRRQKKIRRKFFGRPMNKNEAAVDCNEFFVLSGSFSWRPSCFSTPSRFLTFRTSFQHFDTRPKKGPSIRGNNLL